MGFIAPFMSGVVISVGTVLVTCAEAGATNEPQAVNAKTAAGEARIRRARAKASAEWQSGFQGELAG
jgi:hypothetical protein